MSLRDREMADDSRRRTPAERLALVEREIEHVHDDLDEVKLRMARDIAEIKDMLVTKVEFHPIKLAVYGIIAILCSSVLGAIIALAWKQP
jgi:hypothetical protein